MFVNIEYFFTLRKFYTIPLYRPNFISNFHISTKLPFPTTISTYRLPTTISTLRPCYIWVLSQYAGVFCNKFVTNHSHFNCILFHIDETNTFLLYFPSNGPSTRTTLCLCLPPVYRLQSRHKS